MAGEFHYSNASYFFRLLWHYTDSYMSAISLFWCPKLTGCILHCPCWPYVMFLTIVLLSFIILSRSSKYFPVSAFKKVSSVYHVLLKFYRPTRNSGKTAVAERFTFVIILVDSCIWNKWNIFLFALNSMRYVYRPVYSRNPNKENELSNIFKDFSNTEADRRNGVSTIIIKKNVGIKIILVSFNRIYFWKFRLWFSRHKYKLRNEI